MSGFHSCGLQAAQDTATQIRNGSVDIGIAMGADYVKESRELMGFVYDASPSHLEAGRPCKTTNGPGLVLEDLDIPSHRQDQYTARTIKNFEKSKALPILDEEIVSDTATFGACKKNNPEEVRPRDEKSLGNHGPVSYEGSLSWILLGRDLA